MKTNLMNRDGSHRLVLFKEEHPMLLLTINTKKIDNIGKKHL